jgi:hypothetical protein
VQGFPAHPLSDQPILKIPGAFRDDGKAVGEGESLRSLAIVGAVDPERPDRPKADIASDNLAYN